MRSNDFVSSKLGLEEDIYVVGANDAVRKTFQDVGILESFQGDGLLRRRRARGHELVATKRHR
ncbi:MAG TPA: hypothetical protein VGK28_11975 [Candidatus Dormibacteraeota bacterium]